MPLVHVAGLNKFYTGGTARLHVLRDLDVDVAAGEMVAVVGASGVGKSTLLHRSAGSTAPTAAWWRWRAGRSAV